MLGRSPDSILIGRPAQPFSRKRGNKKRLSRSPNGVGFGGRSSFGRFHWATGETFFLRHQVKEKPGGGQNPHWRYASKLGDRGNIFLLARSPYGDRDNLLIGRSKTLTWKPFESGDRGNLSIFCRLNRETVETFPHGETKKRLSRSTGKGCHGRPGAKMLGRSPNGIPWKPFKRLSRSPDAQKCGKRL